MTTRYTILPELNLILYVCEGVITREEFYSVQEEVIHHKDDVPHMISILDLTRASLDFNLDDMKYAIEWSRTKIEQGHKFGPMAIITLDKGIKLVVDTLNLMSTKVDMDIKAFGSIEQAIAYLGLDHQQQIVDAIVSMQN